MAAIRRVLLRLLDFFRSGHAEADLAREIKAHLQLLEDTFIAQGMTAADARLAARRAFGGVEQIKEHQRDARSFRWLDGCWLDLKLGVRLLIKYPGLTLVGGLAIAFAIATGAATFELLTQLVRPTLPLDEGDRVVGIRLWHTAARSVEEQALFDFVTWREELESIEDLGAFRTLERNLIVEGLGEPVQVAEISASAFRLARVPPLLGRSLVEADEQAGAPAVVVLGYDVWQTRFGGAPDVVGRTVRLGSVQSTVVGVMPESFSFPNSHDVWTPLRLSGLNYGRRQGPEVLVYGRLAPGVTLDQAQAELTSIGRRMSADFPDTHEHLRPQVMPYALSISFLPDLSTWESLGLMSINLIGVMLLVLICGNVALLMFARAATRETEILVRNALGASRGRIIMQLFAEALVLGGVAAAIGLAAAGFGLRWGLRAVEAEVMDGGGRLPFWFTDSLSPATLIYAGALTALGAVIAGVVPALKVTRGLGSRLSQASAGGGGLRFGGLWTAIIVTQVAVTVVFPAVAFCVRRDMVQIRSVDVGFPAEQYLSVRLEMDRETASGAPADASRAAFLARFRTAYRELERHLAAEPAVAGVTVADLLPRMYHERRFVEVDEGGAAPADPRWPGYGVSSAAIDADYFDVLSTPIVSGRGFHSGDLTSAQRVAIVNQSFVDRVLGDRNPLGRRIRDLNLNEAGEARLRDQKPGPWHEIVGVVADMGMAVEPDPKVAGFYQPLLPGDSYPLHMAVHVRGQPEAFAPRLRAVATTIAPTLRIDEVQPLDKVTTAELQFIGFWFRLTVMVSSVALLLSLAGIYAVMSFTVSRRTREIGIRVALGARPQRVVAAIFRRPLAQVGLGVVAGGGLVTALTLPIYESAFSWTQVALIAAYAAFMLGVCLLACIVPTRRALRVEPTEALRQE